MDPKIIRPRRDWVLILDDRRIQKLASGLFLPINETGVEKVTEGAGTVIKVGPGIKNDRLGLRAGDRVIYRAFLKYANTVETEEVWEVGVPKKYFLMSSDDLMAVVEPGVEVGVFSSPTTSGKAF